MNGWGLGGILGAGLGLIVLEVLVTSSSAATTGFAALLQLPGQWAAGWLDPSTPLLKAGSSSGSSSSSTSASSSSTGLAGNGLQAAANAVINPGFATPGASGGKKRTAP